MQYCVIKLPGASGTLPVNLRMLIVQHTAARNAETVKNASSNFESKKFGCSRLHHF